MKVANNDEDYGTESTSLWEKFKLLCRAVDKSQPTWGLPAYNGGLFSRDPKVNSNGAALDTMVDLADKDFGPALGALLVDNSPEGKGPVDFRELSVREFGTIYEGLLESHLAVAKTDLAIKVKKRQELYVPTERGDEVVVKAGAVYLRNQSGARKATGSYFTKAFAVDHILKHSLAPALDDHLIRVAKMIGKEDEVAVARALFDFRCADIAMGSGHFLVAALDMIAERFTAFLNQHDLPSVTSELKRLLIRARQDLGDIPDGEDANVDDTEMIDGGISFEMLLRRQIARHCIYGVDLHDVAVELAKVALWVHTFVPGLPLTLFNHNLRQGDSLTGMCDVQETSKTLELESAQGSLFFDQLEQIVNQGAKACEKLGNIHVDTVAEIDLAREAWREAEAILEPARQLFDLATAKRAGVEVTLAKDAFDERAIEAAWRRPEVQAAIQEFRPLHFQVAFPEVFSGERGGFDCLVGNPPWDEVKVDKHVWWGMQEPGIRALPDPEMNRRIEQLMNERPDLVEEYEKQVEEAKRYRNVLRNSIFDLGAGDTDLYKVFAWRFHQLTRVGGHIGIILPRQAFLAVGSKEWRKAILKESPYNDVTILTNKRGWVFLDVHHGYVIALCSIHKGFGEDTVGFRGPYNDLKEYKEGCELGKNVVSVEELFAWSEIATLPKIPVGTIDVFRKLKHHTQLQREREREREREITSGGGTASDAGQTLVRIKQVRELDQTNEKGLFPDMTDITSVELWPVYRGKSFDLWTPDRGAEKYVALTNPQDALDFLQEKRQRQAKKQNSHFYSANESWLEDPSTLHCYFPRVAFRATTGATNLRTSIACLVPPKVLLVNSAPYLYYPPGSEKIEAFYLGVMSSVPFDWYVRRILETAFSFAFLKESPFPTISESNPLCEKLVELAGRLAAVDERYEEWAEAVGVPVASANNDPVKSELIAELDAAVALLYGLDKDDLKKIWETFHPTTDHLSKLDEVLSHHSNLQG